MIEPVQSDAEASLAAMAKDLSASRERIFALEDALQAAIIEIRAWYKQTGTTAFYSSLYQRICIVLGPAYSGPGDVGEPK